MTRARVFTQVILSGVLAVGLHPVSSPGQPGNTAEDAVRRSLDLARASLDEARAAVDQSDPRGDPPAVDAVQAGRIDRLLPHLDRLFASSNPDDVDLAFEVAFRRQDTRRLETWNDRDTANPRLRVQRYRWLFFVDDLAGVEALTTRFGDDPHIADLLATGRLRAATFAFDDAKRAYEAAVGTALAGLRRPPHAGTPAGDPSDRFLETAAAQALLGLSDVAYRERDFDLALDRIVAAIQMRPLDANLLYQFALVLIRHGRTEDAITATELAVQVDPLHENAHYLLGNGYARKNYTQLYAAYPGLFPDPRGDTDLDAIDAARREGDLHGSKARLLALQAREEARVDLMVRCGTVHYDEGEYDDATHWFQRALEACPEYGRAHNGLAKALEAKRLAKEVHRARYEAEFAATPMPRVEGIEDLVINWNELQPRHRKQVALAVEPWARFIPAIVAGGSTYYIKPLHELLGETPGQRTLRDQRISYDSRLWDDVRGCGGYHTVTGVEDVERSILGRYNTVLHELTHQVHGVLSADRQRQIQELYRQTKERDRAMDGTGESAFLSRYAGGSVWEYLAEGANALASPRRDAFDTREIVRERLLEMDPPLTTLVRELMERADVDSCYPVAYVNRGYRQLEDAEIEAALESCRLALRHDPQSEAGLSALVYVLQLADSTKSAVEWAERALQLHPASAPVAIAWCGARWHHGEPLRDLAHGLAARREDVRPTDRHLVDRELGRLHRILGDAEASRTAYERALDAQSDDPEALWGRARALFLAGRTDDAWTVYEDAVRARTGIVELRCDFAHDLLTAGLAERAASQIQEAVLLDPDDPGVLATEAWLALERGDLDAALGKSDRAITLGPWVETAWLVRARVLHRAGRIDEARDALAEVQRRIDLDAPPTYAFRARWGRYDEVWTLPADVRETAGALQAALEGDKP